MIEYSQNHFEAVCRAGTVQSQLGTLDEDRRNAVRRFWTYLLGGTALALFGAYALWTAGWETTAILVGVFGWIGAIIASLIPLHAVGEALKHPALEELARQGGMEYLPTGFDPPVYPDARKALFGNWLSAQTFTDLFHGTDPAGQRFALYEAELVKGSGKQRHTVFKGQVFAFQRGRKGQGTTVIVPDRGLFNFFTPGSGMERVRIEGDAEFERRFEVYSTAPMEARMLVASSELRQRLLELRQQGRVFGYVGPDDALVAATAKNKFEAGSMFSSRSGKERVRTMFDDVCASLQTLKGLKAAID